MDNQAQVQLLRGLIRMQVSDPHAYDLLIKHIHANAQDLIGRLIIADDVARINRLQGGIKTIKELLEYIEKPNELLHSIEKDLS